jgi:uncharacterized membrane protein
MKKITLLIVLCLIFVFACQEIEVLDRKIELGTESANTAITSIQTVGKSTTIVANTTVGAKYSIQIYKFGNTESVKTVGFTATEAATIKTINLDTLSKGMYDLVLVDIAGNTVKKPLIIN